MQLSNFRFTVAGALLPLAMLAFGISASAEDSPLKVVSYNIRNGNLDEGQNAWSNRADALVDQLKQMKADIYCLQECLDYQRDRIVHDIPGLYAIGEGREEDGSGEICCILIDSKRFDLADTGTFWLNDGRLRGVRGWDAALPRTCTYAHLYDKLNSRGFYVYNTHFDHRGDDSRYQSALLLINMIQASNESNGIPFPTILCGDLNADEGSKPVALLTAFFQDCFKLRHPNEKNVGTFNDFVGMEDGARIDYVLADKEFEVADARIVRTSYRLKTRAKSGPRWASDHFPVVATLKFIRH